MKQVSPRWLALLPCSGVASFGLVPGVGYGADTEDSRSLEEDTSRSQKWKGRVDESAEYICPVRDLGG